MTHVSTNRMQNQTGALPISCSTLVSFELAYDKVKKEQGLDLLRKYYIHHDYTPLTGENDRDSGTTFHVTVLDFINLLGQDLGYKNLQVLIPLGSYEPVQDNWLPVTAKLDDKIILCQFLSDSRHEYILELTASYGLETSIYPYTSVSMTFRTFFEYLYLGWAITFIGFPPLPLKRVVPATEKLSITQSSGPCSGPSEDMLSLGVIPENLQEKTIDFFLEASQITPVPDSDDFPF